MTLYFKHIPYKPWWYLPLSNWLCGSVSQCPLAPRLCCPGAFPGKRMVLWNLQQFNYAKKNTDDSAMHVALSLQLGLCNISQVVKFCVCEWREWLKNDPLIFHLDPFSSNAANWERRRASKEGKHLFHVCLCRASKSNKLPPWPSI